MKNESNVRDRYYQFSNGTIVRRSMKNLLFYTLDENNQWVTNGYAMSKFYDAASEYDEISEDEVRSLIHDNEETKGRRL